MSSHLGSNTQSDWVLSHHVVFFLSPTPGPRPPFFSSLVGREDELFCLISRIGAIAFLLNPSVSQFAASEVWSFIMMGYWPVWCLAMRTEGNRKDGSCFPMRSSDALLAVRWNLNWLSDTNIRKCVLSCAEGIFSFCIKAVAHKCHHTIDVRFYSFM